MNPNGNFFGQLVSRPGINVNNATANQLIYSNDYSSTLYYNTTGVPTVLLGVRSANANNGLANSEQGLYVAVDDIDVTQATDQQLVFNSSQDIFKIVQKGITEIPAYTANGNTVTAYHGLGYAPIIQAYAQLYYYNFVAQVVEETSYVPLPTFISSGGASLIGYYAAASGDNFYNVSVTYAVDNNNIYFTSYANTSATYSAIPITYYIMQETAAPS